MRRPPALAYVPGSSPLHRAPVGGKLAGLAVVSAAVVLADGPWADPAGVAAGLGCHAWARLPGRALARALVPVAWVAAVIAGWTVWARGWEAALSSACDVLAVVVLAAVVTGTTAPSALLDALVRPLRWVQRHADRVPALRGRVDAERVALTFSLTLAAIPAVQRCVADAREAAAARGLGRSWRAVLVPTAVRTVDHALRVSDALVARGLGD